LAFGKFLDSDLQTVNYGIIIIILSPVGVIVVARVIAPHKIVAAPGNFILLIEFLQVFG
jgi:hypothetical protein